MPSLDRLRSLDVLRGLAVFLMFLHHFPEYLMRWSWESDILNAIFIVSRLAAPLFLFVSGLSLYFAASKRVASLGKLGALRHVVSRGALVFSLGLVLSLIIMKVSDNNILYTIGLSIIVFSFLALSPKLVPSLVAVCLILITSNLVYEYLPIKNILASFQFPILPWGVFLVLGIIAGKLVFAADFRRTARIYEAASIVSILISAALISFGNKWVYAGNCSASFVFFVSSILFYVSSISVWIYEVFKKRPIILSPLEVWGKHALLLYIGHLVLIITVPKFLGLSNKFSFEESVFFMFLFMAASFLVLGKNKPLFLS